MQGDIRLEVHVLGRPNEISNGIRLHLVPDATERVFALARKVMHMLGLTMDIGVHACSRSVWTKVLCMGLRSVNAIAQVSKRAYLRVLVESTPSNGFRNRSEVLVHLHRCQRWNLV